MAWSTIPERLAAAIVSIIITAVGIASMETVADSNVQAVRRELVASAGAGGGKGVGDAPARREIRSATCKALHQPGA